MLRQVQEGLRRETAKKLRFVPGIIYVDEGAVCGQSPAEREETLLQMEAILRASGFPYHLARLEEVFDLPGSVLQRGPHRPAGPGASYKEAVESFIHQHRQAEGGAPERLAELSTRAMPGAETPGGRGARPLAAARTEQLLQLFGSVKTLTAKEELLQALRTSLILHTARAQGYAKVLMGDSCTRLAVKLLTNLSLGRGASLAMDTVGAGRGGQASELGEIRPLPGLRCQPLSPAGGFGPSTANQLGWGQGGWGQDPPPGSALAGNGSHGPLCSARVLAATR
nr:cytoplasmic tRNA 2-thiolation protein 2 [Pelodiscus sinensis]|eukprot:XP_014430417.1 cytoplasmic tRNA 2-thiolation protein 2 [Pelodiscus sinensis]